MLTHLLLERPFRRGVTPQSSPRMSPRFWSFALQWSRVGINAGLFLIAARFLTLAEIGAFATVFAPIRLTQGLHKAGIGESVIILGP